MYMLGLVTYFQLNRGYIAEELCVNKDNPITMCYGQCFLNKNLKLVTETEKQEAPVGKHKLEIPVFVMSEMKYSCNPVVNHASIAYTGYSHTVSADFSTAIFHPPALLS